MMYFEIIEIFDSKLITYLIPPNDARLPNYNHQFCPTELDASGTLIFIWDYLSYKNLQ